MYRSFVRRLTSIVLVYLILPLNAAPPASVVRDVHARRWDSAVRGLDRKQDDFNLYLKAVVRTLQKKQQEAVRTADRLLGRYPTSPWRHKAAFLKADTLAGMKRFSDAVTIYQQALARLGRTGRRVKMASIYQGLGDDTIKPKEKDEKVDSYRYRKAAGYYKKALELGQLPGELTARLRLSQASSLYRAGRTYERRSALGILEKLAAGAIDRYPKIRQETLFYLAACYASLWRSWEARSHYYSILRAGSGKKYPPESGIALLKLYRFDSRVYSLQDLRRGEAVVSLMKQRFPKHKLTRQARAWHATALLRMSRTAEAITAIEGFLGDFPSAEESPALAFSLGESLLIAGQPEKALARFRKYLADYPASKFWSKVQERIVDIAFRAGTDSFKEKHYMKAAAAWEEFQRRYPLDSRAPQAAFLQGTALEQAKQYEKSLSAWKELAAKYPGTEYGDRALLEAARVLSDKLHRFTDAFELLKKVQRWRARRSAALRKKMIESPFLELRTEKVVSGDEGPTVAVKIRNIKKMKVRIYNLNLNAYFRKTHSITDMDKLDIDLIKPDREFTYSVKEYAKYRLYEKKIGLTGLGPGAWLVHCRSDKLKATTLVIISDLGLIVRASGREIFALTTDNRSGRPVGGANLIFSDGKQIFLTGKTGSDGTFRKTSGKSVDGYPLAVFAWRGPHTASVKPGALATYTHRGKSVLAHVATDRPAYRPGDTIRFRVTLQERTDGSQKPARGTYLVAFRAPSGLTLYSRKLKLSSFGTASGEFRLDSAIPAGSGSFRIMTVKEKYIAGQSVPIRRYTPKKSDALFTTDKPAYFPGDKISLTLALTRIFGTPAGREYFYFRINDGQWKRHRTDASGKKVFTIDSARHAVRGKITVRVKAGWSSDSWSKVLPILDRDFSLSLKPVRRTWISGEDVRIAVNVTTLPGADKSRRIRYTITREISTDGIRKTRSEVFKTGRMSTGSSGKGTLEFGTGKPGVYKIEATGAATTGEPVTASTWIRVPGSGWTEKLHFLNETDTLKDGRDETIILHSFVESRYTLLTVERDRILYNRMIRIRKGKNRIKIPANNACFPNCRVSLSVPGKKALHTASADFTVQRKQQIAVRGPSEKEPVPGSAVSLDIDCRDQNGTGRNSEVFIAVVDDSLFRATGFTLKDIGNIFNAPVSFNGMKVGSFTPFKYTAKTSGVDQAILKALGESDKIAADNRSGLIRDGFAGKKQRRYRNGFHRERSANRPASIARSNDESSRQSLIRQSIGRITAKEMRRRLEMVLGGLAFYSSTIITDGRGRKTVRFTLPDTSTRWRVVAFSVDKAGRVGSVQKTFNSRHPLHLRIDAPTTMLTGDRSTAKAVIINTGSEKRDGTVVIRNGSTRISRDYSLKPGERSVVTVKLEPASAGTLTLSAKAGRYSADATVTVKRPGTVLSGGNSGISSSTVRIFPDCSLKPGAVSRGLEIRIDRPLSALFDNLPSGFTGAGSLAAKIGTLLRLTGRYHYLKRQASWTGPRRNALENRITDLMVHLRILQKQDWNGQQPAPALLAYAYYAVSRVKALGIDIKGFVYLFKELEEVLQRKFRYNDSTPVKAVILFALAANKKANFAYLNRLYRQRASLANRELALLTSALTGMDRQGMARECATLLSTRFRTTGDTAWLPGSVIRKMDWFSSITDQTALGALALLDALPDSRLLSKAVGWLLKKRGPYGWRTGTANGMIPYVISRYLKKGEDTRGYRVTASVNGLKVGVMDNKGQLLVRIPGNRLKNGRNNVVLTLEGKGRFLWSVVHRQQFDRFIESKGSFPGKVNVSYGYPLYRIEDASFPEGYSIIKGRIKRVKNKLKKVAAGEPFTVRVHFDLRNRPVRRFLAVLTIPPGCRLLSRSTGRTVEHFEQQGDKLFFWLRRFSDGSDIRFNCTLVSELPGNVTIPPVIASPLNNPDAEWHGAAKTMAFLPEGQNYRDGYILTPDQHYRIGLHYMEKEKPELAFPHLTHCFEKYTLEDSPYKTVVKHLLTISIKKKIFKKVIRYFEILKERDPDMNISLEDAAVVSRAYSSIREHERAYQILSGILEARFLEESGISGAFQDENRIKESVAFMERLFLEYPAQSTQRTTYYSLAHQLYSKASETKDAELKKLKLSRKYLFDKAQSIFERYMLLYPDDPKTPEAAFSVLSLLVEQEKYDPVITDSRRFAKIHNKSAFLDAFEYLSAYSLFFKKRFREAVGFCSNVAEKQFPVKTGGTGHSRYRFIARHMLGKIYHSMQSFRKALDAYEKVRNRFPDAARSIDFLKLRHLSIPEVTTLNTTEEARLRINFKGVKEATLTLYRVDFLLLCMKEKDLSRITRINLAGIKPYLSRKISLSDTMPYLGQARSIPVPVRGPGAYLVVLKANGVETSGMILRSDVRMDVLELSDNGIARISLVNSKTGKVVPGAAINFISGSGNSIKTVKTDLRGIAETDGLTGIPTIVGLAGKQYAFFRGSRPYSTTSTGSYQFDSTSYKKKALRALEIQRRGIQQKNQMIWNKNIKNEEKGLKLKKAF